MQRPRLATAFSEASEAEVKAEKKLELAEEQAQQPTEPPSTCFNKKGQVCNKRALGDFSNPLEDKMDHRNTFLKKALAMEDTWGDIGGGGVLGHIDSANAAAKEELDRVVAAGAAYARKMDQFKKAFADYKVIMHAWEEALYDVQDDYTVHCRQFHDVTMQCERNYRSGLRWWWAREPLPQCLIGVVTPYKRLPVSGGLLHWLGMS